VARKKTNPYRRKKSEFLEFEEYDEDEGEGIGESMDYLAAYELNPRRRRASGRGRKQRQFGPGGGHYHGDSWHAGGGRYRDPSYLPARFPGGSYHAGGGHVSHGFHPGSGSFSNNPGRGHVGGRFICYSCGKEKPITKTRHAVRFTDEGSVGLCRKCDDRMRKQWGLPKLKHNPPGRGRRQRQFGPGGGHYHADDSWHAGGGRYRDPSYLPARFPGGSYHAGGGHVSHGFHPGSGSFSNNPPFDNGDLDYEEDLYESNPRLTRPPRDPYAVPAYNNPYHDSMLDDFSSPYSSNPFYAPPAFGYGHLPYAAKAAPGWLALANPPRRKGEGRRSISRMARARRTVSQYHGRQAKFVNKMTKVIDKALEAAADLKSSPGQLESLAWSMAKAAARFAKDPEIEEQIMDRLAETSETYNQIMLA
jgi:hypothetical protein